MARLLIVSQLLVAAATSQQVWWQYVKGYCTVQLTRRCNGRAGLLVRMNTAAGKLDQVLWWESAGSYIHIYVEERNEEREERRGDSRNAGRSRRLHTPRPLIGWEAKFAFNSCGSRHYCVRLVDGSRRAAAETIELLLWPIDQRRSVMHASYTHCLHAKENKEHQWIHGPTDLTWLPHWLPLCILLLVLTRKSQPCPSSGPGCRAIWYYQTSSPRSFQDACGHAFSDETTHIHIHGTIRSKNLESELAGASVCIVTFKIDAAAHLKL